MFEKLSPSGGEKWTILGAFLIMLGIFLPWYRIESAPEIPWAGVQIEGTVYGYSLTFGQIYLILTGLLVILTLIPQKEQYKSKFLCGQLFLGSLIAILFVTNVLAPIFQPIGPEPHFGLLPILVGCILLVYGLKKEI